MPDIAGDYWGERRESLRRAANVWNGAFGAERENIQCVDGLEG